MEQQPLIDGRYAPRGLLGSGGMAKVYLAHDKLLGRDVALKILREQYAENEEFVERFRREAQSSGTLSHPNIVPIYNRGEVEDGGGTHYYMVMEYLPGGTLKEHLLREGPLDPAEAIRIALGVAQALKAAHEKGIVHRDIKPHNVLLTEKKGDVKVGDFGIARAAESSALTEASLILGTARYVSPEQAKGEEVGPKSDLYSLGVTLYEMLTGRVPFDAESTIAIAMKHVTQPPLSLREANPCVGVPEGLNAITLRLLSKESNERYADAAGLIDDLERAGRGLPPVDAPAVVAPTTTAPTTTGAVAGRAEETATVAMAAAKASTSEASTKAPGRRPTEGAKEARRRRRRWQRSRLFSLPAAAGLLVTLLVPAGYLIDHEGLLTRLENAVRTTGNTQQQQHQQQGGGDVPGAAEAQEAAAPVKAAAKVLSDNTPVDVSAVAQVSEDPAATGSAASSENAGGEAYTSSGPVSGPADASAANVSAAPQRRPASSSPVESALVGPVEVAGTGPTTRQTGQLAQQPASPAQSAPLAAPHSSTQQGAGESTTSSSSSTGGSSSTTKEKTTTSPAPAAAPEASSATSSPGVVVVSSSETTSPGTSSSSSSGAQVSTSSAGGVTSDEDVSAQKKQVKFEK